MTDPDVRAGRLSAEQIEENFGDIAPTLARAEALIEADRCYFCFDAPCTTACPTDIDIPGFIQQIRSDNIEGSAHTILRENIMGGMCARVCPTEVLCEEACVRHTHEDQPVRIGRLQRYATDPVIDSNRQLFSRAADSGKTVAVIGGGPAALSCAHRLSVLGHAVKLYSRDNQLGGLNEYGIAAYKTANNFAQREVDYILDIGGIDVQTGAAIGSELTITKLIAEHDAVFLGVGLGDVNSLRLDNEGVDGVIDAVQYIAELRQAKDKSTLPVGRRVVVIGGGMTAIDIAVQSKRLGAEQVDMVYRRGPLQMGASEHEQELAQTSGVTIRHWSQPVKILGDRHVRGIEFERTRLGEDGSLEASGEFWSIDADVVFKAVGQTLDEAVGGIALAQERGKIKVDDRRRTSIDRVWAGGDCVAGGEDLTVSAVQDGKIAAIDIDRALRAEG